MSMITVHPFVAFMILYLSFSFGLVIGCIRREQIERKEKLNKG
ncbi:MAG: hypothetical protein ABFD15_06110 [Methanofastidiosum sp.]